MREAQGTRRATAKCVSYCELGFWPVPVGWQLPNHWLPALRSKIGRSLGVMAKTLRAIFRMTGPESGVAAMITLVLMFAPLPLIALRLALRADDWRASVGILLIIGALTALVVAIARSGLREHPTARTTLALAYALMWFAGFQIFLGACVLLTGHVGGRNYDHRVYPRKDSLYFFAIAAGFGVMSAAGFLLQLSRQKRRA